MDKLRSASKRANWYAYSGRRFSNEKTGRGRFGVSPGKAVAKNYSDRKEVQGVLLLAGGQLQVEVGLRLVGFRAAGLVGFSIAASRLVVAPSGSKKMR